MAELNPFNPTCAVNACLNQVIGYGGGDPVEQVSSCMSLFGTPVVVSTALPASIVFSTTTTTVPYIDITVTTSTTFSTVKETTTSTVELAETVTEFTSTRVSTTTAQVTASPVTFLKKRKSPCKPHSSSSAPAYPSSVSSSVSSLSSFVSPSGSPSAPSSFSTISAPSSFSTISAPPSSLLSSVAPSAAPSSAACTDIEQYSSACRCIYAVSSQTTVTIPASTSTSTVTETTSSAVPSVSTITVIEVATESITELATITATTTLKTVTDTTTAVTSTTAAGLAPTVTALIRTNPLNRLITVVSQYVQYDYGNTGNGARIEVVSGTGQVNQAGQPSITLWLRAPTTNYGVLWFQAAATKGPTDLPVTCFPDLAGVLACSAAGGFNTIFSCGAYMYLGRPTWVQAGCTIVKFTLSRT